MPFVSKAYIEEIEKRIEFLNNIDDEDDRRNAGIFLTRFTKCGEFMNAILGFEQIMISGVDMIVTNDIVNKFFDTIGKEADEVKKTMYKASELLKKDIFIRDRQILFYGKTTEFAVNNRINSLVK